MNQDRHVGIVGGGIAGLAAAATLAREGHRVTLFEKAREAGGRAVSHDLGGARMNLGPHALYRRGAGRPVLDDLGVTITGRVPAASGGFAVTGGTRHALPGGFVSLLTTSLLGPAAKVETGRLLATFGRIDARAWDSISVADFLVSELRQPATRDLVAALFRLTTYGHAPQHASAGVAIRQLQLGLTTNVLYLDGGWQSLVDGLRKAAEGSGTTIRTTSGVTSLEPTGKQWVARFRDGTNHELDTVVLAVDPRTARDLLGAERVPEIDRFARSILPVRAACLDLVLSRLPAPKGTFALGIARPFYFSVHSEYARLVEAPRAVVHVAAYLDPEEEPDAERTERELEAFTDVVQPGWRDVVAERRYLPSMNVVNALATARAGGLSGRPGTTLPNLPGVFLAGDWLGPSGYLADGSLASAKAAAEAAASYLSERRAA